MLKALVLAFVLTTCAHVTFCDVSYVVSTHNQQTAMIKVIRDDTTGEITECYIFADPDVTQTILDADNAEPIEVNKGQFQKLLRECEPTGRKSMRNRVKKNRAQLVRDGKAMRAERKKANEERKKHKAAEAARKEGKGKGKGRGGRHRRDIVSYEMLYAIYPGTLWCGAGNISEFAEDPDGLGELKDLDAACRTHDGCEISITGWSSAFGLINTSPITCSDCDCDELFLNSLKAINDEDSNFLGDLFFNVISLDCIKLEFPWKCVSYDWFGIICLEYERDESAVKEYEFYDGLEYPEQA